MFGNQRVVMCNGAHECWGQLPSLGYPCPDFRVIHLALSRKIHIDNHFPNVVEQAGHETEILLLNLGSLCNECRCLCRREGVFPELCAIFPTPPDCSADENTQRELLEHVHANDNHRVLNRADRRAMSIVGGICKTQDPRG